MELALPLVRPMVSLQYWKHVKEAKEHGDP